MTSTLFNLLWLLFRVPPFPSGIGIERLHVLYPAAILADKGHFIQIQVGFGVNILYPVVSTSWAIFTLPDLRLHIPIINCHSLDWLCTRLFPGGIARPFPVFAIHLVHHHGLESPTI